MRVLIIEDEYGVAQNLCDILQEIEANIEILAILESIKDAAIAREKAEIKYFGEFAPKSQ